VKNDPIVAEVRKLRQEYFAQFDYDLNAMFEDLRRKTEQSKREGRRVAAPPARRSHAGHSSRKKTG
jgi:hypothetical protein